MDSACSLDASSLCSHLLPLAQATKTYLCSLTEKGTEVIDMAKLKATAKWVGNARLIADNSRAHTVMLDLPKESGGEDSGPTPLELALMSLAGCAATMYVDIAKRSGVELTNLVAVVEAEKPKGSPKLTSANLKLKVSGKAREQLLEIMWRKAEEKCPVMSIFKDSIPVKTELEASAE